MKNPDRPKPEPIDELTELRRRIAELEASESERQRADEALRQRNRNLTLLNQAGQDLTATLDLQRVVGRLLQTVTEITGAEGASVWLAGGEHEGSLIWLAASPYDQPPPPVNLRLQPGQGIVGWVAQAGESIIIPDVAEDPRFFSGVDERTGFHTVSLLAVPLWAGDTVMGVLEVVNKLNGEFGADDLTLVEALATSAAIAIENASLHQELQDYSEQLERRVLARTAEVQAQYARLEAVLRSASDGIIVTDGLGQIVQVNPLADAWLTQTLSPEEAERLRAMARELARRAAAAPANGGRPETVLELTRLDLELKAAPISGPGSEQPLPAAQHEPAAVVSIHDVSHLRALDRMKTRFVTNISHELRTPVTTIQLYAHLMQQQPDKCEQYLGTLAREADHQARLVERILEIADIDAGRLKLELQPVALHDLVDMTIANRRAQAQERGLTLVRWPAAPGPVALIDPGQIARVMNNLVDNAILFTPQGGRIAISTGTGETGGRVWSRVTVTDTGIGIPEDELPHVFERFFRGAEPRSMQISGAGLGLAVATEIVELHGGRLTVESQVTVGATFIVWLPLA